MDLRAIVQYAPQDSALVRDMDPDWWVTAEVRLAREVEHNTRVLSWLQSKDGSKGRNFPKRINLTRAEREDADGIRPTAMPVHELNEWLGGAFAELNQGGGSGG